MLPFAEYSGGSKSLSRASFPVPSAPWIGTGASGLARVSQGRDVEAGPLAAAPFGQGRDPVCAGTQVTSLTLDVPLEEGAAWAHCSN